jgi:uncharacterized membrane protein YccF (DUF307 family)
LPGEWDVSLSLGVLTVAANSPVGVGNEPSNEDIISSGIELDKDFVPAEVTRYEERVPDAVAAAQERLPRDTVGGGYNSNVTNVSTTVNVGGPNILITTRKQQVPFILRAIWFLFIGFWLSAIFIFVGFLCCVTVILAPVGFWFLNRVPQAQTLRMRNTEFHVTERDGVTHLTEGRTTQLPWYYRAVYFPVGLVLGFFWLSLAWIISLPIITLPLSVWMIDRSPAIISLQRN